MEWSYPFLNSSNEMVIYLKRYIKKKYITIGISISLALNSDPKSL